MPEARSKYAMSTTTIDNRDYIVVSKEEVCGANRIDSVICLGVMDPNATWKEIHRDIEQ